MKVRFLILICVVLLTSCSTAPYYKQVNPAVKVSRTHVDLGDSVKVKEILNQQYRDFRHVRYREGGLSRKGIDCSGLVYLTYRQKFGVDMPRSTDQQSEAGREVRKKQLKAGDLVFFKTGLFTRHVGIYMNKGKFLHASSSRGVVISSLDDEYWLDTYWKARRIQ